MSEPRPRVTHDLKTRPEEFQAVLDGRIPWQLRRNDRNFQVGDQLLLKEWFPGYCLNDTRTVTKAPSPQFEDGVYSGREALVRVDYIMGEKEVRTIMDLLVMMPGFIIMSISHVH